MWEKYIKFWIKKAWKVKFWFVPLERKNIKLEDYCVFDKVPDIEFIKDKW